MAAKDSLGGQFWGPGGKMFHVSSVENRQGIETEGLRPGPAVALGANQPVDVKAHGVYVSEEPLLLAGSQHSPDYDVYAVDTQNLPSMPDESSAIDRAHRSRFIPGSIPPERIQRITGEAREQVNAWRTRGGRPDEHPFKS